MQPFTLDERLAHARQAEKQLGATIPWLVDAMDNRLKHALGDRPNSEFIIDPKGKIVRKRAWSNPAQVRKDLEELVGQGREGHAGGGHQAEHRVAAQGGRPSAASSPRIQRPRMQADRDGAGHRPQGAAVLREAAGRGRRGPARDGEGKLYLGFHLDPFHEAHWNNLTPPLKYKLELPEGAKIAKSSGEAAEGRRRSATPTRGVPAGRRGLARRQADQADGDLFGLRRREACHVVEQEYVLRLQRDKDGGGARGEGAGFWDAEEFARQLLARDKNGDGKLDKTEVHGPHPPALRHFDTNKDGLLDAEELKAVTTWLNTHHEPGIPVKKK